MFALYYVIYLNISFLILQQLKAAIVKQLVGMYGPRAAHPTQIVMKDWTSEQWSRGCYVAVMNTGVLSEYGEGNSLSFSLSLSFVLSNSLPPPPSFQLIKSLQH